MDIDTESSGSRAVDFAPTHSRNQRRLKAIAYDQVLHLLRDSNSAEANLPGFEDELWTHFHRLPPRYALNVNVERAKDVLMHKRLLHMVRDPATRHAIDVRVVQAHFANSGNCIYSFYSNPQRKVDPRCSDYCRENGARHEITISTNDKPQLLSQLTSLLSEIGLNIQEAHAFSTVDGYSLDYFLVDGWALEETEQLRNTLVEKIPRIEVRAGQAGLNQAAMDGMAGAESSRAVDFAPTHSRNKRLEVIAYNQVLHLLKDSNLEEANLPGFEDELFMHFHRLPASYALNVNVERAQDVLMHKRLLHMARDPATRLAIEVRVVQAHFPTSGNCSHSFYSNSQRKVDPQRSDYCRENGTHPPTAFGSSPDTNDNPLCSRAMHEITISTNDKPKLLSQFTSLLSEIGLNIREAHAFSTVDGYSLDYFLVDGWALEETEQLRNTLVEKIPRIEVSPVRGTVWSWET